MHKPQKRKIYKTQYIAAIVSLFSFIGLASIRMIITLNHNNGIPEPNYWIVKSIGYGAIGSIVLYVSLQIWYRKTKHRWL